MRELFTMWRNTRMIVLTAISAAAYVAVLVPFKGFVLIPGFTEIRPGAAIPIVLSFLFGPAAAWGSGFGNLIADALGGTLGPGSIPGFLGNFVYGYLPYALWRALTQNADPLKLGAKGWVFLVLILLIDCLAIGSVIGWGADLLRLVPFAALGLIIAVNNFIASAVISTVLLALLYPRIANWGLLYHQILDERVMSFDDLEQGPSTSPETRTGKRAYVGVVLVIAGVLQAFAAGFLVSLLSLGLEPGAASFASEIKGTMAVTGSMAPGLVALAIGMLLL